MARVGEVGADQALTFLREVDSINMRCRSQTVELAREAAGGSLIGAQVAIPGAAFKPGSDDVRDSPALNIAGQIQLQGSSVTVFDPKAPDNSRRSFRQLDMRPTPAQHARVPTSRPCSPSGVSSASCALSRRDREH